MNINCEMLEMFVLMWKRRFNIFWVIFFIEYWYVFKYIDKFVNINRDYYNFINLLNCREKFYFFIKMIIVVWKIKSNILDEGIVWGMF